MNKNDLTDAIGEIDDRHIEASGDLTPKRTGSIKRRWPALAAAAALLLAVGVGGFALRRSHRGTDPDAGLKVPSTVQRLAVPAYPERVAYTRSTVDEWREQERALRLTQEEREAFQHYLDAAVPAFLGGKTGENAVCSPMDIYIGLAMLTETTGGGTRDQLLALLGQDSVEEVRRLTNRAWNALYVNDGVTALELATSLWLRDGMTYDKGVLRTLADSYYASAFSGVMGSEAYNGLLRDWLNGHTGGLLEDSVGGVGFTGDTAMALVSTVYFKDKWYFNKALTALGDFHAPTGDVTVDYMHQTISEGVYRWGDKYAAVTKSFENSTMVLILPDEGVTPEELLRDPQALALLNGRFDRERMGVYEVELTLPRFDIADDGLLNDALKSLGVTDAFDVDTADFSPLDAANEDGTPAQLYLSRALHGARVKVDEEGCEGAAYAVFETGDGSAAPPDETERVVITFDRPFLFAVLQNGLPVFTGIVNEP